MILSRKEVSSFQDALLNDFHRLYSSLYQIKVERATSFVPEDRERIFEVIKSMGDGVDGFNNFVMSLIRSGYLNQPDK
jgi:hypothetical protein